MTHSLVLGLFDDRAAAAAAAHALHGAGIDREHLSVVARTHDEEGRLADELDGRPGAELEGSPRLARLGELSGVLLAAVAVVMPGIGPIVTAGPLSAGLGEAAGDMGGGLVAVLVRAGVSEPEAAALEHAVRTGAVLLGVHAAAERVGMVRTTLGQAGARTVAVSDWQDGE
jgi:hypothetical protein